MPDRNVAGRKLVSSRPTPCAMGARTRSSKGSASSETCPAATWARRVAMGASIALSPGRPSASTPVLTLPKTRMEITRANIDTSHVQSQNGANGYDAQHLQPHGNSDEHPAYRLIEQDAHVVRVDKEEEEAQQKGEGPDDAARHALLRGQRLDVAPDA